MNKIVQKIIRVVTVAPLAALLLIVLLRLAEPAFFGGTAFFLLSVLFLTVLPILAYPLQPLLPRYRGKGREGQRNLAIQMANIGYILGTASAFVCRATDNVKVLYLTYLFSCLVLIVFNKLLRVRASGHAAGVAGPIAMLIRFIGAWAWFGLLILAGVYWASLKMKRHTLPELVWGTVIPAAALLLALLCVSGL